VCRGERRLLNGACNFASIRYPVAERKEVMKKLAKAQKQERPLPPVSEQLRECLKRCGKTRYSVSQATGIAQSILSRFMARETGLSSDSLDALGRYLRLEVKMHGVEDAQQQGPVTEGRRKRARESGAGGRASSG